MTKSELANMLFDCADRATIDFLYQKMGRAVMAKAFTVVGSHSVAAEVVQEVFLSLWRSKARFENERAVYGWLYKACTRKGIDYLRSNKRRKTCSIPDEAFVDENAPRIDDVVLSRDLIAKHLATLSSQQAEILVYVAVDRMTQDEVADLLGVSLRTVQRELERIKSQCVGVH